jgi:maltose O-acetyltransferase
MTTRPYPFEVQALRPSQRMALDALSSVVLGTYRLLLGPRLEVGEGVIANHRLIIKGPGGVRLGDHVNLFSFGIGRYTRLIVRTPSARIVLGEHVRLNGTDLQADTLIEIGPDCILGQAHIMDTDMHSTAPDRRSNPTAAVRTEPVVLERNVWVARGAAILPGVRIGADSVVAYGSVVTSDVPPGVVVAGNPARVVQELA